MPDTKITALATGTVVDTTNDWFVYVDVSDTSMASSGTDKRVSLATLAATISPTALAAIGATTLLGNPAGSSAAPSIITLGSGLSFVGSTLTATGGGGGSGTVTSVSVVTANGVSGSVANATTTPAITISLGDIAPTSVAASGTVTGSNLSGANTGDQTFAALSPLTTLGDLLIYTTVNTRLAGNITTAKLVLTQTGAGANSAAPVWGTLAFSNLSGTATAAQLPTTGLTITQDFQALSAPADGATINFDLSTAKLFVPAALGGNRALTVSNSPTTAPWVHFTVILTQDATGSRTISSWFSGITIRWVGGSAPTLTTTANKSDAFVFIQIANAVYLGFIAGQNL